VGFWSVYICFFVSLASRELFKGRWGLSSVNGSVGRSGLLTTGLVTGISIGLSGLTTVLGVAGLSGLDTNLPGLDAVNGLRPQLLA